MLFALGLILPFLTGQIPTFGKQLLPMHLPVLLCGFLCAWQYGLAVGLLLPLTRCLLFGAPALFPDAISMTFELAAYGFMAGLLFSKARWKCLRSVYRCLLLSMVAGRLVSGIAKYVLLGIWGTGLTWQAFFGAAVVNALPGIVLQLVLIPAVLLALGRTHMIPWRLSTRPCK